MYLDTCTSTGWIVAVCILCLIIAALVGAGIWYIRKSKKPNTKQEQPRNAADNGKGNPPNIRQENPTHNGIRIPKIKEEPEHAQELEHKRNAAGARVRLGAATADRKPLLDEYEPEK